MSTKGNGKDRWGLARAVVATHLCLFLPFAWLVLIDYPWNSYRWTWVRLWPILPGFLPGALLRDHMGFEPGMYLVMALATAAEIVILTAIGRRGRAGTIGAGVVALAASAISSRIAYAAFLF